jgi:hypothetical protein
VIAYSFNKTVFTKIQTYILDTNIIKILDSSNHVIDAVKTDAIISISLVHSPIKTAKNYINVLFKL